MRIQGIVTLALAAVPIALTTGCTVGDSSDDEADYHGPDPDDNTPEIAGATVETYVHDGCSTAVVKSSRSRSPTR